MVRGVNIDRVFLATAYFAGTSVGRLVQCHYQADDASVRHQAPGRRTRYQILAFRLNGDLDTGSGRPHPSRMAVSHRRQSTERPSTLVAIARGVPSFGKVHARHIYE